MDEKIAKKGNREIQQREILEVRIDKENHTLRFVTHIYLKVPRWIAKRRWINVNNPVTRKRLGLSEKKGATK